MSHPPTSPTPKAQWWLAVLAVWSPVIALLAVAMWRTPLPIGETVALLEDVETAQAGSVWTLFDPEARSWYRPLFHYTFYVTWAGTARVSRFLTLFRLVELTAVLGLVVLFARHVRPRSMMEASAAAAAVAVLVGTPGFRDNLEVPMLMTLVGMPLALAAWTLLERPDRAWHAPAVVALLLVAIGYKEQGLVIAPVVLAAWWMGAPGASRWTAGATAVATVAYLIVRFSHTGGWHAFEQDIGLGFDEVSSGEAMRRFGAFPWWVYGYNVVATALNVLFSEPSRGMFSTTRGLLRGDVLLWQVVYVGSSLSLTALIGWWGYRVLARDWRGPWSADARLVVATLLAVAASGALGFNYSRDRLGGMAAVFYALAAYRAMLAVAHSALGARRPRLVALGLCVLVTAWHVRALGTLENARHQSEKTRREWIQDLAARRHEFRNRPRYLAILESLAERGRDPRAPRRTPYPRWVWSVVGEQ